MSVSGIILLHSYIQDFLYDYLSYTDQHLLSTTRHSNQKWEKNNCKNKQKTFLGCIYNLSFKIFVVDFVLLFKLLFSVDFNYDHCCIEI